MKIKNLVVFLLTLVMMVSTAAMASELEGKTAEELTAMIEQLQQELAALNGGEAEPVATSEPVYEELARGAKGEHVKPLQQRLKDLGYLTGSVDGDFGGGTERAVSAFQNQHEMNVTGVADVETQELLFSDSAEKAIVYESLDYKGVSRDPDDFINRYVKFSGKVVQVIEYEDYDIVSFRVATKGNYDDVVYVMYPIPDDYSRILEDDRIEVSGTYGDLYSYETVRGDTVTIPLVYANLITLR